MDNGASTGATKPRFGRTVPNAVKSRFIDDAELYCQMCGLSAGDTDEYTGTKANFFVDSVRNNGLGRIGEFCGLRVLCSTCRQGSKGLRSGKPTTIWLLSQMRRAGMLEQRTVFKWLSRKFGT